jgi:hypothetical protein
MLETSFNWELTMDFLSSWQSFAITLFFATVYCVFFFFLANSALPTKKPMLDALKKALVIAVSLFAFIYIDDNFHDSGQAILATINVLLILWTLKIASQCGQILGANARHKKLSKDSKP